MEATGIRLLFPKARYNSISLFVFVERPRVERGRKEKHDPTMNLNRPRPFQADSEFIWNIYEPVLLRTAPPPAGREEIKMGFRLKPDCYPVFCKD